MFEDLELINKSKYTYIPNEKSNPTEQHHSGSSNPSGVYNFQT